MEKTILERGYITNALTDANGTIYGLNKEQYINDWYATPQTYYWSEVYCEPSYMATIIRKGALLINKTNDELKELHEQSKINLN